jgi:hypothetical protein
MQFKNPEILYALFLLLIPIFIHLFQLRRFQKVAFTNVAFLKKVTIQTRKSSQLKKWLALLMRLLALACLIIAFAQPFTAPNTAMNAKKETVLYIDNSFSMQAKGSQGPLLERALQSLFEQSSGTDKISWFTNDSERRNASQQDFKNEILTVPYSQNQLSPAQVLLKANQLFSKERDVQKRLVYISDFQQREAFPVLPKNITVDAVILSPVKASNIAIDTAFIASTSAAALQLKVRISQQGKEFSETPLSLFNNGKLIAKTAADLSENGSATLTFDIDGSEGFIGKIELNEPNISFDNTLFFSINKPAKIKVLAINEADGNFLKRLFEQDEFQLLQQSSKTLDYNEIPNQNFIILNELATIPLSLGTALKAFTEAGGSLVIIPPTGADIGSYNNLLASLGLGSFSEEIAQEKNIANIQFSHPLFKNVFEKEVANFQFPKVNSFYNIQTNAASALSFEANRPFLLQQHKAYLFTAPINSEQSNFQNSPLIVPTFYNMAVQSLPLPQLYYNIGTENSIAIPVKLGPDEILSVTNGTDRFIPLQQTKATYVLMTTNEEPRMAGNYKVEKEKEFLEHISFNYSRAESKLQYQNPEDWAGVTVHKTVADLFDSIAEANSIHSFWKWFAIFALLFLLFEMLILKYYK